MNYAYKTADAICIEVEVMRRNEDAISSFAGNKIKISAAYKT